MRTDGGGIQQAWREEWRVAMKAREETCTDRQTRGGGGGKTSEWDILSPLFFPSSDEFIIISFKISAM